MLNTSNLPNDRRVIGFTLVEVIIAVSIATLVVASALSFLIFGMKSNASTTSTVLNNFAARSISSDMILDMRRADTILIYTDPSNPVKVNNGFSGNVMVLFYTAWDVVAEKDKFEKIKVYYRNSSNELCVFEDSTVSFDSIDDDFVVGDLNFEAANVSLGSELSAINGTGIFVKTFSGARLSAHLRTESELGNGETTTMNFIVSPRG